MKKKILCVLAFAAVVGGCADQPKENPVYEDMVEEKNITENNQSFSDIHIEVSQGNLTVKEGDAFSAVLKGGKEADYRIESQTLFISDKVHGDLVLTLPRNESYDEVILNVENGHLFVNMPLEVRRFDITVREGDAEISEVIASESSRLEISKGSLSVYGDLGKQADVVCMSGHASVRLIQKETEYSYQLEIDKADIILNNKKYHASQMIENATERMMNLKCSNGNIEVMPHQ